MIVVGGLKREGVVVFVSGVSGVAPSESFASAAVPSCAERCIDDWEACSVCSDIRSRDWETSSTC